MQQLVVTNTFETKLGFDFNRKLAIKKHGPDVIVHLGLFGMEYEPACDQRGRDVWKSFKAWLDANNREFFVVCDSTVGLSYGGDVVGGKTTVVISKPRTELSKVVMSFSE